MTDRKSHIDGSNFQQRDRRRWYRSAKRTENAKRLKMLECKKRQSWLWGKDLEKQQTTSFVPITHCSICLTSVNRKIKDFKVFHSVNSLCYGVWLWPLHLLRFACPRITEVGNLNIISNQGDEAPVWIHVCSYPPHYYACSVNHNVVQMWSSGVQKNKTKDIVTSSCFLKRLARSRLYHLYQCINICVMQQY